MTHALPLAGTFESDVYSFGINSCEIVSRKIPSVNFNAGTIFRRVVLAGKRLQIPSDTATDMSEVIRSCWQENLKERLKFPEILESIKTRPK